MTSTHRRAGLAAALVTLPLALAACGSSGSSVATSAPAAAGSSSASMSPTTDAMDPAAQVFGAACSAVPKDGAGSFTGMATDPVATAASHNPVLSTLVTAVTKAGLGDSLNSAQGITVFAPINDAFGKLPKATLDKALGDPKGLLSTVLTYHVVPGKVLAGDLKKKQKVATVEGGTVVIKKSKKGASINNAKIVQTDIQGSNGVIHVIDTVLLPKDM